MRMFGTSGSDIIQENIGTDDFIFGRAGADTLEDDLRMGWTPPSDDVFSGGSGKDRIYSFFGSDLLYGNGGSDEFDVWKGGEKRVVVDGGRGNDTLTLWDFDEDVAEVKVHDRRTVIEEGGAKIVIHDDVEKWEFF